MASRRDPPRHCDIIAAGEDHWHGPTMTIDMSHVAVGKQNGAVVTWMDPMIEPCTRLEAT